MVCIAGLTCYAADKSADAARDSVDATTKANEISERFYQLETQPHITLFTPKLSEKEVNYLEDLGSQPIEIFVTNPSKYTVPNVGITFCFIEWGTGIIKLERPKERSEIKKEEDYYGYKLIEQIEIREIEENYHIIDMIATLEGDKDINSDIQISCIEFLENLPQNYIKTIHFSLGILFPNDVYRITLPNDLREKYLYVVLTGLDRHGFLYSFKVKEESSN